MAVSTAWIAGRLLPTISRLFVPSGAWERRGRAPGKRPRAEGDSMRSRSIGSWELAGARWRVEAAARRASAVILFSIACLPAQLSGREGVPDGTDQGTVLIGE